MKNIKTFLFALFALTAARAYSDFNLSSWEYDSKINLVGQTGGYVELNMPSEILAKIKPDFSDLRIINEDGEVPYIFKINEAKSIDTNLPTKIYNLGTILGKATSFVVDIGQAGILHSRVTIETASQNFQRGVEVYSSDDQNNWQLINSKGQIFDFTDNNSGVSSRYTSVNYPASSKRYLRIVINDFGETPLNITGASVDRVVEEKANEILYTPSFEISDDQKNKITDIITDIGSDGIPTSNGELKTSDDIFSRPIIISESSDKNDWLVIGRGYIFSIDTPKFAGTNLKFFYPESKKRFIKISVQNGDDKPVKFDGVNLSGIARSVVFKTAPGKNYYLYASNAGASKPKYDIEKLADYLSADHSVGVSLGGLVKNTNFVAPQKSFFETFPNALTSALVLIVLLLAGLVVKLFTSVR